jgi:hypothetical protein
MEKGAGCCETSFNSSSFSAAPEIAVCEEWGITKPPNHISMRFDMAFELQVSINPGKVGNATPYARVFRIDI